MISTQYTDHQYQFIYDPITDTATFRNYGSGASKNTVIGNPTTFTTYPIEIFGVNTANTRSLQFKGKLYSCQFYNYAVTKMDLVPCYRRADNVVGVYDLVSGEFITTPQGVSQLVAGPDV